MNSEYYVSDLNTTVPLFTYMVSSHFARPSIKLVTGTGLLPYIRPLDEALYWPLALMSIRAYRPYRFIDLKDPGEYQVFSTPV